MKKIGVMTVPDDYIPNMADAYSADVESGSHHLSNLASKELNSKWPTVIAMANLIEAERDALKLELNGPCPYCKMTDCRCL